MRHGISIAALLLVINLVPGRADASCAVHQDLSNLHRASKGFLAYLSTGKEPQYVQQLQSWITANPTIPLRQRMQAVGIQQVEGGTLKLMQQQVVLLHVLNSQGRSAARDTARHLGIHGLAAEFGTQVEALPCDQVKEPGNGSKLVAVAADDARQRQQIINAAIAWVSFLVLGGSVLYFLDRIGIRKIRRTKRHPCAVPCVLETGSRVQQCHLVDLSRAGAKVRHNSPYELSGRVVLNFGGYNVEAQVRWKTADYIGVKFAKDFNFMQLHRLLEAFPMSDSEPQEGIRLGL